MAASRSPPTWRPAASAGLQAAWRSGDLAAVAKWRDLLTPLNQALFVETNPIPVKYAASLLGHAAPTVRLPLIEASPATQGAIAAAMRHAGLLN